MNDVASDISCSPSNQPSPIHSNIHLYDRVLTLAGFCFILFVNCGQLTNQQGKQEGGMGKAVGVGVNQPCPLDFTELLGPVPGKRDIEAPVAGLVKGVPTVAA